jgi:hypothetical protein
MFWARFESYMRTQLIPLSGDPDSPRGGVSSRTMHCLVSAWLPTVVQPRDIFMQVGASVHTAHIIRLLNKKAANQPPKTAP